jgi:hypothetical protein
LPLLSVTHTAVTDAGLFVVVTLFQQSNVFVAEHLFCLVNAITTKSFGLVA